MNNKLWEELHPIMNKEEPLGGENILESEGNTPNGRMSTSGEWMTKAN